MSTSSTVLGYKDDPINSEDVDYTSTFIGGHPVWPTIPFNLEVLNCKNCNKKLSLVMQAYAPLDISPNNHRSMFLFMCYHCASPSSWRYFRLLTPVEEKAETKNTSISPVEVKEKEKETKTQDNWGMESSNVWGDGGDDWGANDDWGEVDSKLDSQLIQSTTQQLQNLSISQTDTKNKERSEDNIIDNKNNGNNNDKAVDSNIIAEDKNELYFGWYWMVVDEEVIIKKEEKQSKNVEVETDAEWGGEEYEKVKIFDKYFSKFLKQLSFNEEQFIRYEFKGNPLFLFENKSTIPKCPECSNSRVFELQIMPNFVTYLSQHIEDRNNKYQVMSVGSIFLYSCSTDCVPKMCKEGKVPLEQYLIEEHVIIQESI